MGKTRYQADGFIPINEPSARETKEAAIVTIKKGDALHDNGAGLATNATVSFDSATFMGIAAADCDNSGDENLKVEFYPLDSSVKYIVPVEANALITQTVVGTNINLENNDDVDVSDAVTTGLGFKVQEIDVSAPAIVANTYGYAIGTLRLIVTES